MKKKTVSRGYGFEQLPRVNGRSREAVVMRVGGSV